MAWMYATTPDPPAPLEFLEMAQELMDYHNLNFPRNVEDAIKLYIELVAHIEAEM